MRNQVETIYVVLFLTIAILIILLSFYALTYNYNQNIVFNRFTSLSTLSNYFLGYLQTSLTQEGYAESYEAEQMDGGKKFGPLSLLNVISFHNHVKMHFNIIIIC